MLHPPHLSKLVRPLSLTFAMGIYVHLTRSRYLIPLKLEGVVAFVVFRKAFGALRSTHERLNY